MSHVWTLPHNHCKYTSIAYIWLSYLFLDWNRGCQNVGIHEYYKPTKKATEVLGFLFGIRVVGPRG
jgi:hypothetical protein